MIKRVFLILFVCVATLCNATHISVKVASSPEILYVASYYGRGFTVLDSLVMSDGEAVWAPVNRLDEGIYFLTDAEQTGRFDFLLGSDQDFEIQLNSFESNVAWIRGAEESELFWAYQKLVQNKYRSREEKVAYTRSLLDKATDGSMLQLVLNAMLPVVPQDEDVIEDSFRFWDNYDLSDKRLVRTPFFAQRIDYYLRRELPQRQDVIMAGMLPLLAKAEQDDEVLKLVATTALNYAVENTIMGIDALGYEVISRYYLSGRFGVLPQRQLDMLNDYVKHTVNCRVGHKGKDIIVNALEKEKGQVSLYAVDAPYVLLLFWEPDCDYCKRLVPSLRDGVLAKYHNQGLRVFAVNTQNDYDKWKNYVVDNELFDWCHGYLSNSGSACMTDYGVQGTPFMYILDNENKIIAKNVSLEHLDMMLDRLFSLGSIY